MRKACFIFTILTFVLSTSNPAFAKPTFEAAPEPLPSVPVAGCSYKVGNLAPYSEAKNRVDFYEAQRRNPASVKNTTTYSFSVDINDLDCYITSATTKGMNFLHFLLGQEQPSAVDPKPPLMLYVAGVNSDGKHIYIEDPTSNFFILQCAPSGNYVLPAEGSPPLYTNGTYKDIIKLNGGATVSGGREMVNAYYANGSMDHTASSFTYDYDNFLGYVNDAKNKGCDAIRFYIAEDCGRLAMVIVGMKANVPCYINDPKLGVSVMDQLNPCPTCYNIQMGVATLEPPTSN